MSTDPLAELARRARGPTPPPEWDALCHGALTEEERAALLQQEGADALAPLFEPLGPAFAAQLADRVLAARAPGEAGADAGSGAPVGLDVGSEPTGAAEPSDGEPAGASEEATGHGRRGEVIPLRRWRAVFVGLALAALALLVVGPPSPEPALPGYSLEARFGDQAERGATTASPTVSAGSRVTLVARPERAVDGEIGVTARLRPREGGEPVPWGGAVEVSPTGAVRLSGVVGADLVLTPGAWIVEVTLDRPGAPASERVLTTELLVAP